jgi:hypothetical protein
MPRWLLRLLRERNLIDDDTVLIVGDGGSI